METTDFTLAQDWAIEILGSPNIFQTWMPVEGFVKATRRGSSISFTRGLKEIYGLGVGEEVEIDPSWQTFSIPRSIEKERTVDFELAGQWDAYAIATSEVNLTEQEINRYLHLLDDREIADFLELHAPESSTKPGHPEIIYWGGLRGDSGELLAVAALTQWESGGYVLSSVGVHQLHRGEGLAQLLTKAMVHESSIREIPTVALGVAGKNNAAIAVYEKVGFICMGRFNYFERKSE